MKLIILAGCIGLGFSTAAQQTVAPLPKSTHKLVVIAHRGDHEHVPENTVASVQEAIKAGVDYVELDLRTTKDGFLVMMHDGSVDRMTTGKGKVNELSLDTIKSFKLKSAGPLYRVPEFSEILAACRNKINLYLDFKDADVAETYRQIKAAGMETHTVVYLNKESQYGEWRKIAPHMPLMTSLPDNIKTVQDFKSFVAAIHIEVFDNLHDLSLIGFARQSNIAVWLDAEDRNEGPSTWKPLLDKNIQGIQTDHPEELIDYLRKNNTR